MCAGNGTEDIVRRYAHPSRLFFFSLHLFDQEPESRFQFYPGTGQTDDRVSNDDRVVPSLQ
ncbi:hypothetical protein EON64_05230 [archaeon]|nr:MAG: hypothetical protein EON64_05230 [archaeon]